MIKTASKTIRHAFVKLIAPKLYQTYQMLPPYKSYPRPMIDFCKSYFNGKHVTGLEIGVAVGKNSESMIKTLNVTKLYLVDPYQTYYDHGNYITLYHDKKHEAAERLQRLKTPIQWIYKTSEHAAKSIPNHLDFIYIDGNHTYPYIKRDIELYYPKIRSGGIFGGHDYSFHHIGVVRAVSEFIIFTNQYLYGKEVDWWVIK